MKKSFHSIFDHFCHHSKRYGFIMLVSILIAGLWPFNFATQNRAVIDPEGGLVLSRHGTVYEAAHVEKLHGLSHFTIYLDLTTASSGLSAFEKIVSLADSHKDMNFIVGQWKDGIVLHLPDQARQKEIHFGEYGIFKMGERTTLMITYDGAKLILYRNNRPIKTRQTGPLSFDGWSRDYPLVVGTEATGKSQWRGTIYEIALWDKAMAPGEVYGLRAIEQTANSRRQKGRSGTGMGSGLTNAGDRILQEAGGRALLHYVFRREFAYETEYSGMKALGVRDLGEGPSANLIIPAQFIPARRAILVWESDWTDKAQNWQDVVINVAGFIPLGILLFLFSISRPMEVREVSPRKPIWPMFHSSMLLSLLLTVSVGFLLSIFIEYLQAYLPSRDSSLRDLIMNTAGTLIGWVGSWALLIRLDNDEDCETESSCPG